MKHKPKDIQYCERLFQSFYEIGSTPQGGVTRLGYTETEDAMHEVFKGLGRELLRIDPYDGGRKYLCGQYG